LDEPSLYDWYFVIILLRREHDYREPTVPLDEPSLYDWYFVIILLRREHDSREPTVPLDEPSLYVFLCLSEKMARCHFSLG